MRIAKFYFGFGISDFGLGDENSSAVGVGEKAMTPDEMKKRTKQFGLRVIRLVGAMPGSKVSDVIGRQLLRAGTGVGANYRAACRSRSDGDFLARMGIVEEEADESLYWMEMLIDADFIKSRALAALMKEAEEILAIVVSSINTARGGRRQRKQAQR